MDIKYFDYQKNIIKQAISSKNPKIYVFDNYNNREAARDYHDNPVLEKQSLFMTVSQLKEKLLPTDKLILKEEKLALIFYEILSEKEKEKLNIDDYFDVIDFANQFFNFFEELNEYNVDKIDNLENWQQDKFKILKNLRKKYINKMEGSKSNEYESKECQTR